MSNAKKNKKTSEDEKKNYQKLLLTCVPGQTVRIPEVGGGGGGVFAIFDYCVFRSKNNNSGKSVRCKSFVCDRKLPPKLGARQKRAARAEPQKKHFWSNWFVPPPCWSPTTWSKKTNIVNVFWIVWKYFKKFFQALKHDLQTACISMNMEGVFFHLKKLTFQLSSILEGECRN